MKNFYIIIFLPIISLFSTPVFSSGNVEKQLDSAIKALGEFMSYEENVDTFENYWLIAKAVANIDPVNSRKKIDFLMNVCNQYTLTDQAGASALACNKIWYMCQKLDPKANSSECYSKNSPIYLLLKK